MLRAVSRGARSVSASSLTSASLIVSAVNVLACRPLASSDALAPAPGIGGRRVGGQHAQVGGAAAHRGGEHGRRRICEGRVRRPSAPPPKGRARLPVGRPRRRRSRAAPARRLRALRALRALGAIPEGCACARLSARAQHSTREDVPHQLGLSTEHRARTSHRKCATLAKKRP